MNTELWNKVGALYNAYDGSIPWMEFMGNYRKSSEFERDVWLLACRIHHTKDKADLDTFVTVWSPFMETIPLIGEIWQYWRKQGDAQDVVELDAGVWEITQIQQWRGGEYWMVYMRRKNEEETALGITSLKRVNGKIAKWESEEIPE